MCAQFTYKKDIKTHIYILLYYRQTIVLASFKHEQASECNVYYFSPQLYKMAGHPPFNHSPIGSLRFYFIQAILTKAFVMLFPSFTFY